MIFWFYLKHWIKLVTVSKSILLSQCNINRNAMHIYLGHRSWFVICYILKVGWLYILWWYINDQLKVSYLSNVFSFFQIFLFYIFFIKLRPISTLLWNNTQPWSTIKQGFFKYKTICAILTLYTTFGISRVCSWFASIKLWQSLRSIYIS